MKNILISQNPHWDGITQNLIKRDKLEQLIDYLPLRQVITISGIRRCGKSSLARLAIEHLIQSGVERHNILFVNLEQPFFLEFKHDANYLETIYETYLKLMHPKGKIYIIFDEVQFFDNWQVYIKSKYESHDIKFIITGSNSSLLSNELNTLLSGRSLNVHLTPFSFKEFLNYKGIAYENEFNRVKNRIDIARAKEEYLIWGGFYEVFETPQERIKREILISYAKNIIYQDIVPRYNIRNSEVLERLFFYLLSNATGILNYTTLSETFSISVKSIKEYINYFEDVFLMQRIDKFHNKPKERITSAKKLYVLDNGFLTIAPKHSKNMGALLENLVFNTLYQNNRELAYLKERYEVDFYTHGNLYQVAYDISEPKTRKRELNAFEYFKKGVNGRCFLITNDVNEVIDKVEIVSLERFLVDGV